MFSAFCLIIPLEIQQWEVKMNIGQTVFSQIIRHLPRYEFNQCVERYQGNRKVHSFSCWEHLLCMLFAQLTYRESLRDRSGPH